MCMFIKELIDPLKYSGIVKLIIDWEIKLPLKLTVSYGRKVSSTGNMVCVAML